MNILDSLDVVRNRLDCLDAVRDGLDCCLDVVRTYAQFFLSLRATYGIEYMVLHL
jgi:hypothetical protein